MPVEWIEHKGKRILLCDHRNLESDEVIATGQLAANMVQEVPEPAKLLFLTDFEGAVIDTKTMANIKEMGQTVFEPRTEKSAVVGITGIRHILLAAYNRFTGAGDRQKLFDNHADALDWLVSD